MGSIVCVGSVCYRVVWCKDLRMVKIFEKLVCGLPVNHRTGRYKYALFYNGPGFLLRRKDTSLSDWEQPWEDVCVAERVS